MDSLDTIRINNNASIKFTRHSSGEKIAVVDDFLLAPEGVRSYAKNHAGDFYMPPKSYPGVVLPVDAESMRDIYRFVRSTLGPQYSFLRGGSEFTSMLSMTTLQPNELSYLQRLCHCDPPAKLKRRSYAFVLYLFDDERLGGTGFYRWKEEQAITDAKAIEQEDPAKALAFLEKRFPTFQDAPCYMTESSEIAERLEAIPAKFNRLIFYSGDILHSAQITSPELLTSDADSGRLTLNCIASVKPVSYL